MWFTLAIFCCFQLVDKKYFHFVETKNMAKIIEVEELEKIEEDKLEGDEPMCFKNEECMCLTGCI